MQGKQSGDFWRDKVSGLWHVQMPHGEWTFKTKKRAEAFAAQIRIFIRKGPK